MESVGIEWPGVIESGILSRLSKHEIRPLSQRLEGARNYGRGTQDNGQRVFVVHKGDAVACLRSMLAGP
jgi:hypothetical protein